MPDAITETPPQPGAGTPTPAAPASVWLAEAGAQGAPGGDFNPTEWLSGLNPHQRAAVDEYAAFRTKPLESEKHGLISEVGRLKKASDPAIVARLSNEEGLLEQYKSAAIALYGVDAKDMEGIESLEAFNVALRFMSKTPKVAPAPKMEMPNGVEPKIWEEFLASRQAAKPPAQPGYVQMPARGGVPGGGVQVTADNIDALYMDSERKGLNPNPYAQRYNQFLRYGRL